MRGVLEKRERGCFRADVTVLGRLKTVGGGYVHPVLEVLFGGVAYERGAEVEELLGVVVVNDDLIADYVVIVIENRPAFRDIDLEVAVG